MQDNSAVSSPVTGSILIDGMLGGTMWAQSALTYAFPAAFSQYGSEYPSTYGTNFQPFSAAFQANALTILSEVSAVTMLTFSAGSPETATLRFGRFNDPLNLAYGFFPSSSDVGGDTWFANNDNAPGVVGDAQMHIVRHEIGHALGLKHPHEGGVTIPAEYDSNAYTAMSYNDYPGPRIPGAFSKDFTSWEQSLMGLDIQALQAMYGANFSTNAGDTVYTFSPSTGQMLVNGVSQGEVAGNRVYRTIWDGGGNDTYDFSNYNEDQNIDLNPGMWSTFSNSQLAIQYFTISGNNYTYSYVPGNIANPFLYNDDIRSLIENIRTGDGADVIVGNIADNHLMSGGGDDTLEGGAGNDRLDGGSGRDTAVFAAHMTATVITYNLDGTVTVSSEIDGTDTLLGIEFASFAGVLTELSRSNRFADPGGAVLNNFAVGAGGWSSQDRFPRMAADVNGDGFADIVGFGQAGTLVALGSANDTFSAPTTAVANFGVNQGWTSDNTFHREMADVNNDGRADVVGFGTFGVQVALAQANGTFASPITGSSNFNPANGWSSQDVFTRTLADVNGDGFADVVGFGIAGTFVALGTGSGTFGTANLALANFGRNQGWSSDAVFHRELGDVNGDGRDDIVGFGTFGTLVALGQASGTFAAPTLVLDNFGTNQGWSSQDAFPRDLGDVDGDGRDDIVGFGVAGTFVAYGQANGTFSAATFDLANFGRDQGWSSDNLLHRELADMNGDGTADIIGFGTSGVFIAAAFDGVVI